MSAEESRREPSSAPEPPPLSRLLGLARPHASALVAATALLLVASAAGLATPALAGRVVDAALIERSEELLNRIVLALIALFAVLGGLSYGEHYLLTATGARLLRSMRERVFSHLVGLAPEFYGTRRVGELMSRLGSDLAVVQGALTHQIPAGIHAALRFAGTLAILLVLHTRLTAVALLVVPPVVLLAVAFGRKLERLSTEAQDALAATAARAEETLSGIRTVQSFQGESFEARRYGERLRDLLVIQLRNARVGGGFIGLMQFAGFGAFAIVLGYGGRLMLRGQLTPGELTAFLLYTFSIAISVGTLGGLYAGYRELRGASARIFEILDTSTTIAEAPGARALENVRGEVAFEGVSFRYPGTEVDAVADLSLRVAPGRVVGLVGPSGAGKSTLFALLMRFHDVSDGAVRVDGRDVREVRLADLRRAIGVVPQEIFLFSDSVAENIRYGRPEATDEEVRAAARAAGADEFVRALPKAYEELVGERGVRLSAGQRQRIAIARAFLRDPAILLLDEATSSLDPESEERVRRALEELLEGRTTLVIAHRLATAQRADEILVLDGGRIAGRGTHAELFAGNDLYRRYWKLQSLRGGPDEGSGREDEGRESE